MAKLLNTDVSADANDDFRQRLLKSGLSSASLFYCELMGREEISGRPCTALSCDVYAVYTTWCERLDIRPCAIPHFVQILRTQHGVVSKRLRYTIDGKQAGPHGVLVLSTSNNTTDAQIAVFRQFATKIQNEGLPP